jgi:DNA-directed RNA polymerase specialized sigma24 family protein
MSDAMSVTVWILRLREGDPLATQKLWEAYFQRLVGLARGRLRALARRAADEEDVALSAFDSFFRGVQQGRFPRLDDRDDLWQVLLMITERKSIDLIQYEGRAKRDWRRERGDTPQESAALEGREPDPAFVVQIEEELRHRLGTLADDQLRQIAVRKMEGYTNQEIAAELDCSLATVERRLRLIRRGWSA